MEIKVRFAPSPTGIPHVGNIRTALFNYFFAKANNGRFILRIEDTDQARKIEGAVEATEASLDWLSVSWDEKIVQSSNLKSYQDIAQKLVAQGKARDDNGAVRFIVPEGGSVKWTDAVGNKVIEFKNEEVESFIILKSDGYPTYHLANVVDDRAEQITHVIRGEDWISSTPKHILLYKALGWGDEIPVFVHVPNIFGTDGKKLSKRRGAKSVLDYRKQGILADALLNYLMLLGWNPKNDREILSREEIEKEFKLENINVSPAIFDEKKLTWMNGEYIRKVEISKLKDLLLDFDPSISNIVNFERYIPLAQTRMKTLSDFRDLITKEINIDLDDKQRLLAQTLRKSYSELSDWDAPSISRVTMSIRDDLGSSTKDIFKVLTGRTQGLPFDQSLELQGKEETLLWLDSLFKKDK